MVWDPPLVKRYFKKPNCKTQTSSHPASENARGLSLDPDPQVQPCLDHGGAHCSSNTTACHPHPFGQTERPSSSTNSGLAIFFASADKLTSVQRCRTFLRTNWIFGHPTYQASNPDPNVLKPSNYPAWPKTRAAAAADSVPGGFPDSFVGGIRDALHSPLALVVGIVDHGRLPFTILLIVPVVRLLGFGIYNSLLFDLGLGQGVGSVERPKETLLQPQRAQRSVGLATLPANQPPPTRTNALLPH